MVFDLMPIIIILAAFGIIAFILVKKFPQTANVDVEKIPEEKQQKLKKDILEKQLEKQIKGVASKFTTFISPLTKVASKKLADLKGPLLEKKKHFEKKSNEVKAEKKDKGLVLVELLDTGASFMENELYIEAEEVFIKALEIDKHESLIYKNLGEIYMQQKKYNYAIETFNYLITLEKKKIKQSVVDKDLELEHILKMDLAQIYFELAKVYKCAENIKKAKVMSEKALTIDYKNPRYLDFLCEICILSRDKLGAKVCVSRLRQVNSQNNKIESLEDRIEQL